MIKKIGSILQSRGATKEQVDKAYKSVDKNTVHCIECDHLQTNGLYGVCEEKYCFVNPDDFCEKGEKKNG